MSGYRAFVEDDDENAKHRIEYYHNPSRWQDNVLEDSSIRNESKWSNEIKYLNSDNTDVSNEIKAIPNNSGGIYIFYIKGPNLSFIENHILYIGRCRYTNNQNIRKRALEYYTDKRILITKMFKLWKNHLYYRYYASTNNEFIDKTESTLIRAILPPMNEIIPDKINIQPQIPAFN